MTRSIAIRFGLRAAVAAVLLGTALVSISSCARSERKVLLVFTEGAVPTGGPAYRAILYAGKLLSERTNGRIRVQILAPGADVDSVSQIMCRCDMPSIPGLAEYYRPIGVLEAPYMFRDVNHYYKAIDSPIGQRLIHEAEIRAKLHVLDVWHLGTREVTLRNHPATTPKQFGHVKLRVPPSVMSVEVAKVLGALPTTIGFNDVYANLRAGTVDGQENPLPIIKSEGFYKLCPYLIMTNHVIASTIPAMSDYHWAKLTPGDRTIIRKAFHDARAYNRKLVSREEHQLLKEFEASSVKVIWPNLAPFRARARQSWRRFSDVWGDSLVAEIQAVK